MKNLKYILFSSFLLSSIVVFSQKKNELRKVSDELESLLRDFFIEITPYVIRIGIEYQNN